MLNHLSPFANPRIRDLIAERVSQEAQSGWLFDHKLAPEDRTATLRAVFLNSQPQWRSAFAVMLLLATGVASFGLSENSAATIIGAMIIAPLGQPIVALGAAASMAWVGQAGRMLGIIIIGAAAVVACGYVIGILMPDAPPNEQILARTSPDFRDLGVALLAGGAGAYAYTRDELSGVLPGVAIAVALVPPLAVVGMMLEEGHQPLAMGAFTLFVANLLGIALAAGFVMLVTGFAPRPRLKRTPQALLMFGALLITLGLVMVPLGRAYMGQIEAANSATAAHQIAQRQASASGTVVQSMTISGAKVTLDVEDASTIDKERLQRDLRKVLGPNTAIILEERP